MAKAILDRSTHRAPCRSGRGEETIPFSRTKKHHAHWPRLMVGQFWTPIPGQFSTPIDKYVTQNGLKRLGLENLKSFATRGVIIDLVRVFKEAGKLKKNPNCKADCLEGGTIITAADLQAGLKIYNVTAREGDAVFLNTGWEDLFLHFPAKNAVYSGSEPGINKAAAEWLTSQKVVLVGADTWAVEVIPGESAAVAFPVHVHLLADNGVHIIENVRTDLIAAAAQKDGRATFFLNMTVPT
jgi:kynurenine formamidase